MIFCYTCLAIIRKKMSSCSSWEQMQRPQPNIMQRVRGPICDVSIRSLHLEQKSHHSQSSLTLLEKDYRLFYVTSGPVQILPALICYHQRRFVIFPVMKERNKFSHSTGEMLLQSLILHQFQKNNLQSDLIYKISTDFLSRFSRFTGIS